MIVPDTVLKSVAFACYRDKNGEIRYAGTVFFMLDYYDESDTDGFYITVTAKHVIINIAQNSIDQIVLVRINLKSGGIDYVEFPVSGWRFHPDPLQSVDVAVFDGMPNMNLCDLMQTPLSMAVTPEMITQGQVGIGDEVFIVGLFSMFNNHTGEKRNHPILRVGNIAMLPTEPIKTPNFANIEGYLIESRSIGGLSGSPVFVYKDIFFVGNESIGYTFAPSRSYYLLGLIHGHYDTVPEEDTIVEDGFKQEKINMGIAIIVPVSKIVEVVNQPEIKIRKEEERQKNKEDFLLSNNKIDD